MRKGQKVRMVGVLAGGLGMTVGRLLVLREQSKDLSTRWVTSDVE